MKNFVAMNLFHGYLALEPKPRKFIVNGKVFATMGDEGNSPSGIFDAGEGLAIIPILGPMMKGAGSHGYADHVEIGAFVAQARKDPSIKGTMLLFDTPGGTCAGCADAHAEIEAHAGEKPLYSYCWDLCASAGMYLAAPAKKIFANQGAMVGSVGTKLELMDASAMYEKMGIKFTDITTGAFKAAGSDAHPLTPEEKDYFQGLIDDLGDQFVNAVAKGRGKSAKSIREMEAKVYIGAKAQEQGLVDGIISLDSAMSLLAKESRRADKSRNANARALVELSD